MPRSGNFNLIVDLIYPNNSSDGRLSELFVMECWNSPDQGENTIIEPARDSTNRAIGTVLQLDPGCFRNFIRRLLFALVHVNRHLSLLCQCSSPTLRVAPYLIRMPLVRPVVCGRRLHSVIKQQNRARDYRAIPRIVKAITQVFERWCFLSVLPHSKNGPQTLR